MRLPQPFLLLAALVIATCGCGHDKPALGTHGRPDAATDASSPLGDGAANGPPDGNRDGGIADPHVIRVSTTQVADADDGLCSLSEAIGAAKSKMAVNTDDCPAGTGNDVIELPAGTYKTTMTLDLMESIEIRGAGIRETTIAFDGDSLTCGVRLATEGRTVWLTSLTLRPTPDATVPGHLTGVCVTGGTIRLRHARVSGFTAGGLRVQAQQGGYAKLEIYNSLVDDNRNQDDGGGIMFVGAESSISIDQSSIVNNVSDGRGGGLFAEGGTNANYIYNTTFSGNVARRGGGIATHVLPITYFGLYWSTIANNRALEVGGGLYIVGESLDANGTATGSLIAGNSADGDAAQANLNKDFAPGFSCTSSILDVSALAPQPLNTAASCRYDVADAKLGPLMDMGGPDHLPIHALLPGSPAIDSTDDFRLENIIEQRDAWNGVAGDPPIGTNPGDTPAWTLFGRDKVQNPLSDRGAYEFNPRWEAELLTVAERSSDEHGIVTAPAGFSHGAGTTLRADGSDAFVTYQVPVPEAGRHAITARIGTGSGAGQFQILMSDALAGPYLPVGGVNDGYFAGDAWNTIDLGDVEFASFGQKFFKFAITGKHRDSSGHRLVLDYLMVTKNHGYSLPEFPGGGAFSLRLPPPFSPFLPLSGDEATREPPGFYDPVSSHYFSYGFIWWLTGMPDLSTAALRADIRDYYTGLCNSTVGVTVTLDEPADAPGAGSLVARRNGTLNAGRCFGMPVPVAAVEVSTYACPDRPAVIVLISGQPASSQAWADLRNVRDGFTCW